MTTPRIVSWKQGRNFTAWHLANGSGKPLCGQVIPDHASLCELKSSLRVLTTETTCRKCWRLYSEREDET